ncbi:MAG TPA: hypothetical protein VEW93_08995 [Acidimicrobiales bacterium]|nr:hypothetical protein [Acidimicrobiales bacterium]
MIRIEPAGDEDGSHREALDWEPLWDPKLAVALIGKLVLVGVTDLAADGAVIGQRQFCGYAIRADRRTGIVVRLADGARAGEEIVLPADTRAFRPAMRGEDRLRRTDEVATEPDFVTSWYPREQNRVQDH